MINKIKNFVKLNNLDGYVVPKNDEFFTEYSKTNKLEIVAKFTGSAGFILILKNTNHLFVDGRYTIQAKRQSGKKFNIHEIPYVWPKDILRNYETLNIGFDPKLFTKETLKRVLEFNGFDVIDIDTSWYDYIISARVKKRETTDLRSFDTAQRSLMEQIHAFIKKFDKAKVSVWGAGHQALAIMSLANLGDIVRYVVDSAPFKQNKFTPATQIPIYPPSKLKSDPVDAVIVMGAAYSNEIVRTLHSDYPEVKHIAVVHASELKELKC